MDSKAFTPLGGCGVNTAEHERRQPRCSYRQSEWGLRGSRGAKRCDGKDDNPSRACQVVSVIKRSLVRMMSLIWGMEEGVVWERHEVIRSLWRPLWIPEPKEEWAHQLRWGLGKDPIFSDQSGFVPGESEISQEMRWHYLELYCKGCSYGGLKVMLWSGLIYRRFCRMDSRKLCSEALIHEWSGRRRERLERGVNGHLSELWAGEEMGGGLLCASPSDSRLVAGHTLPSHPVSLIRHCWDQQSKPSSSKAVAKTRAA